MPPAFAHDIRRDARGDALCGLFHRVARQMGVARRGLYLAVAQQLPDHREGLAQRQGAAGVRVSQVVDPDALEGGESDD